MYDFSDHGENHGSAAEHDISDVELDDEHARGITVYSKFAHGKGKKDRKLPCYYCEKFRFHMPRHLTSTHVVDSSIFR